MFNRTILRDYETNSGVYNVYSLNDDFVPLFTVTVYQDEYLDFCESVIRSMFISVSSYIDIYMNLNRTDVPPLIGGITIRGLPEGVEGETYTIPFRTDGSSGKIGASTTLTGGLGSHNIDYYNHLLTRVPPTDPKFFLLACMVLKLSNAPITKNDLNLIIDFAYHKIKFIPLDENNSEYDLDNGVPTMACVFHEPFIPGKMPLKMQHIDTNALGEAIYGYGDSINMSTFTLVTMLKLALICDDVVTRYNFDKTFSSYSDSFFCSYIEKYGRCPELLGIAGFMCNEKFNFIKDMQNYRVMTVLGAIVIFGQSFRGAFTKLFPLGYFIHFFSNREYCMSLLNIVSQDKYLTSICDSVFIDYINSNNYNDITVDNQLLEQFVNTMKNYAHIIEKAQSGI